MMSEKSCKGHNHFNTLSSQVLILLGQAPPKLLFPLDLAVKSLKLFYAKHFNQDSSK